MAGRALQGVGAGLAEAVKAHVLVSELEPSIRSKRIALLNFAWLLGFAAGPLLGVCFEHRSGLNWQWSFWLVVPVFVLSGLAMPFLLGPGRDGQDQTAGKDQAQRTNFGSLLAFAAGNVTLYQGLTWAGTSYDWDSASVISMLTESLSCYILLFVCESFATWWDPLISRGNVHLSTCIGLIGVFIHSSLVWISLCFMGVYFLRVKMMDTIAAAVQTLTMTLTMAILALIVGVVASRNRLGGKFILGGWFGLTGSFLVLNLVDTDTPNDTPIGMGIMVGVSMGAVLSKASILARENLSESGEAHRVHMTSLVKAAGQSFGLVIGVAAFANELYGQLEGEELLKADASSLLSSLEEPAESPKPSLLPDSFTSQAILDSVVLAWTIGMAFSGLGLILSFTSSFLDFDGKIRVQSEPSAQTNIDLDEAPQPRRPSNVFLHRTSSFLLDEGSETGTLSVGFVNFLEQPEVRGDPDVPPTIRCVPWEDSNPWTV